MIIDTEKVKEILLDRSVTGYALWKATGVSQQAISRLRSGKKRFEDLSVETVEKVQRWLDKKD
jgi:DNA-binding Xre family transcriptional regulator